MQERTSEEDRAFLAGFQARLTVDIEGLVRTLFTHGSPRSDEEIVTYATPERRMRALLEGVEERVLAATPTADTIQAIARAESGAQALTLLLASPEFLRR